jgi:hypothetical protein
MGRVFRWVAVALAMLLTIFNVLGLYVIYRFTQDGKQIALPPKSYSYSAIGGFDAVSVVGTLTGEGYGYPNNSVSINCHKNSMECFVSTIAQIGDNQLGWWENATRYTVAEWTPEIVVAVHDGLCDKTTITFARASEAVLWVSEPTNQTNLTCKDSDTRIYKWAIEESPYRKKLNEALKGSKG